MLAGAVQARARGGGAASHEGGRLVGGIALHVVQVHGRALLLGQLAHGVPDGGVLVVVRGGVGCVPFGVERDRAALPA